MTGRSPTAAGPRTAALAVVARLRSHGLLFGGLQGLAALVLVPVAVNIAASRNAPVGVFVNGAIIGSLYALVAMGLILIYQTNRIINFAQAGLGAVPAVFALVLLSRKGLPYFVTIPVAILGAAAVGAAIEILVIRRFRQSPRLVLTVATIGLAQLLAYVEFKVPDLVSGETLPPSHFETPFQSLSFNIGIVRFSGDHILTVAVVALLVVGLGALLRFTDVGIGMRAAAESSERAALLGIPVKRISTVVWMIAAVLSAVGIFLRAPLVGLPIGGLVGPGILLYGLAAAVIGRMQSLPRAFVAGLCIGMIDQGSVFATRRTDVSYGIMLGIILVALLLQRSDLSRARDSATSSWQMIKEVRPVPPAVRSLREVRIGYAVVWAATVALAVSAPHLVGSSKRGLVTIMVIHMMVAVSLVVLTGWAGQISLGQFGVAGIGAAVAGGLVAYQNLDFTLVLVLAGLAGAAVAVLIGLPALRIHGLFLAVTTLAFAFTVQMLVLNPTYFDWLLPGRDGKLIERPVLYDRIDLRDDVNFYYVCVVLLALVLLAAHSLRRSRSGRLFIAARDNGRAVQAFGVSPARTRLAAFAISGFIAALAGALLAYQQRAVDALTFTPGESLLVFSFAAIGGLASLAGAVIGPGLLLFGRYFVEPHFPILAAVPGLALLLLLLQYPGGLSEVLYGLRDRYLRRVAARHGLELPGAEPGAQAASPDAAPLATAEESSEGLHVAALTCPQCGRPLDDHLEPATRTERTGVLT